MKKKYILIAFLSVIYSSIQAQLADITYSIKTGNITSYYANDCWESSTEEYTGYLDSWDNVNGTWVGTGCQQCNATYDCTYAANIALQTRSNNAYNVTFRIDAWEDDNGSRCSYATGWYIDNDDCRRNETNTINIRELVYPSNGTYSNTTTWGSTNNHRYYFQYTWKYSGTASLITPNLTCQSSAVTSGAIRSWSVNLTAGQTYAFSNYGSGADTKMRLYSTDGYTIVATGDDNGPHVAGTAASLEYTAAATGTYYLELTNYDRAVLSTNSTLYYWQKPSSVAGFGANSWNILGYNKNDITLAGATYVGNYNTNSLSYNTSGQWTNSPSDAAGWSGGCVHPDYHTVVAKRQGFPCKIYQIDIPAHDDDIQVFINGSKVYEHLGGCCDVHNNIWTGYLTSTSTIEVRHIDGVGGSVQALNLTDVTTALSGGTIAGITSPTTICVSGDPGAFTSAADASGGTIGITNGSPAAHTYQWERAPTSGFTSITNVGTNATTYDPDASLAVGTYYFRRKVTDACGTVAYSSVIQVNVVSDPSAPTLNVATPTSGTTVCMGGTVSATINAGSNGTGTCTDYYQYTTDGGANWSAYTSGSAITAVSTGNNRIQIQTRRDCSGTGCDGSGETFATIAQWTVVSDPTITTQPLSTQTVCIGNNPTNLTVAASGGTGAFSYQWYYNAANSNTGGTLILSETSATFTPPTGAVLDRYYYCVISQTGVGCNAINSSTARVNVVGLPVPTAGSNTPVCVGNSLTLSSSATGGGGSYSYSWSGPSSYSNLTQNPTVSSSATTAMSGTYTVIVTDANSCTASAATAVVVNPLPLDKTVGGSVSICTGGTVNITVASSESGVNYQLRDNATNTNVGSAVAGTGGNINLPASPTATTTYNVLATNGTSSCFKQMPLTATVTVAADPTNVASSDNNGCGSVSSSVAAALTGGLGGSYQWQLNSGAGYADISGATSNSYNYSLTVPGIYKYKVIYTATGTGCDNHTSNEVTVTLKALPNPALSLDKCAMSGGATGYEIVLATIPTANTTPNYIYSLPAGVTEIWSDATGANKIFKQPMGGSSLTYNVVDNGGTGCAGAAGITASANEPIDIPLTASSGSRTADCSQRGFGSVWEHYKDVSNSNNVLVSIQDNGVDLGTVDVISYVDATTPSYTRPCPQGGTVPYYAMKRHYKITSSNYPNGATLPSAVGVRLYFTQAEANALSTQSLVLNADGCEDDDDFKNPSTLSDLYVTKYTGTSEDGNYDNNNFTSGLFRVYGPMGADGRIDYFPASFISEFAGASSAHHYIEFDITEFSEFWLHGAEHGTGLPVKYLYFTARPIENSYIKLDWATASEIDNRGFEIERSEDGMNFTRIGWVDGNGNSTVTHTYSFDDKTALYDVTYYYRLKQIDNSGRSEYSPLASAKIISGDRYTVSEFIPNKVETTSHLNIFTTNDRIVEIEVFNALGQKVNTVKRQLQKGNNTIEFDFSHLASGTYSASIRSNGEFMARKFLMVR